MSQVRDEVAPSRVRGMSVADLERVHEIENRAYGFPWPVGVFRDCLRAGYQCWVIEVDSSIAGYGIVSVAAGESHVLNICIDPAWQRLGLGRILMNHIMSLARKAGAERMILEVRPTNHAARQLYDSLGFNEIGLRRGYYPDHSGIREDALVLARELSLD
ncbi:ribosomal protein S18-alanine N-acetyltransferase [Natronospira bacteriovora]|uniref:[Ribosomal protein bS18]-alanine N-acetyltransferase n=1 Tax=Natronospira bacteriovora TaxID=3069753 RepID=A0ABU0W663_9GAMM|nr:ribosomal protein S18-alanine N-acetyltransferase [Natronospira sp. AB-CW4]MDQ2069434.1 ribosomal protein S18-alanine N-acetyltransferase [Natronospira sp. AB-CW4]